MTSSCSVRIAVRRHKTQNDLLKGINVTIRLFTLCVTFFSVSSAWAFGPEGHTLVGTIAERVLLTRNPSAATKVKALLNSIPLGEAARIADDIKSWDGTPRSGLPWTMDTVVRHDVWEFLQTNSNMAGGHGHSGADHHNFHYTDISIDGALKYSPTVAGAGPTDVVKMITHCIDVIEGTASTPDAYAINQRVAVILLCHYLGDIHQPLHVGAVYFDGTGKRVDPNVAPGALPTHGGNDIRVHVGGTGTFALHAYWDGKSIDEAVHKLTGHGGSFSSSEIDSLFATAKPTKADGSTPLETIPPLGSLSGLSTMWADEILPIAKESHDKLDFQVLTPPAHLGHYTFKWDAKERTPGTYPGFAGDVVGKSIHRAGWRLALLLERVAPKLP
ncbi:MAG: hypothetical protein JSS49_08565 [Planctomycetes bacterium]|nr:hypothetical protein [Planctomycetota bacterium]